MRAEAEDPFNAGLFVNGKLRHLRLLQSTKGDLQSRRRIARISYRFQPNPVCRESGSYWTSVRSVSSAEIIFFVLAILNFAMQSELTNPNRG